ncbi:hypothetical protein AN958_08363 [Leucoagaricus sp. SymC.cos]|nr:hypothetical protein AN958_08363 [Leucoagaricus sp. SymC.cos]
MPTMLTEEEPNLETYSAFYKEHVQQTQKHLQGTPSPAIPTETQYVGSVSWTSTEIDSFFHALTVHSRFRPDLISACIGTKNVLEVVEYLELLDQGSAYHGNHLTGGIKASIAHEMSEDWILLEEELAKSLRARESNITKKPDRRTKDTSKNRIRAKLQIGTDPREPSPVSRRRFQKRMYMRRRRARDRGEEVNTSLLLLKPGRRSQASKSSRLGDSTSSDGRYTSPSTQSIPQTRNFSAETQSQEDELEPDSDRASPQVTTPEIGLSLIHAPNLRNFLRCSVSWLNEVKSLTIDRFHTGLYDKKLLNGREDIDSDVINMLARMTRDLVSDVIGRAIILQEEQKAMKSAIAVWHQDESDNVVLNQKTIHRCLDSIGLETRTRKQYFQDLLTSFDLQHACVTGASRGGQNEIMVATTYYDYLPQSLKKSTEFLDEVLSDEADSVSSSNEDDHKLDREDSLAGWAHEVDLWRQITQDVEF